MSMTCFTLLLVCGVSYSFEHNHFVKHGTGAGIRWRCTPSMSVHSSYWFFPLFFSFLSSENLFKKHENEDEPCVYFSSCCMFLIYLFFLFFQTFSQIYFPNKFAACVFLYVEMMTADLSGSPVMTSVREPPGRTV